MKSMQGGNNTPKNTARAVFAPGTRQKKHSAWDGLVNSRLLTELPHYAINKALPEDSFFTDRRVAKDCVQTFYDVCKKSSIDLTGYRFVEPSAGEGCFYDYLPPDAIGLDIEPKRREFAQADFLKWYPDADGKYVVIGNPPFGHRGAVALAFVNRALLFADIVAFILPMSFYSNGKGSNMKRVEGARLLHSSKLPQNAFYMPETGRQVTVKTLFQIWQKGRGESVFIDYDVSEWADIYTCCSAPSRYCGLGRGRNYDCFIASTFYNSKKIGIVRRFDEVLYGSGYGIIIKKDKARLMRVLENANWSEYCSDATNSCHHIRMYHIRKLLGDNGFGIPK